MVERPFPLRLLTFLLVTGLALTACSSRGASSPPTTATGTPSPSSAAAAAPASAGTSAPTTTVGLLWRHVAKSFGDREVWYVARVVNRGDTEASVELEARAVDRTGTIVGSSQETLPNIPPGSRFDFFGTLGGGGTSLTGVPTDVRLSEVPHPFGAAGAVWAPLLKTSRPRLVKGRAEDNYSDSRYTYGLSVEVTNSTDQEIDGGVRQQVVLYDSQGRVVGGGTGSSDNVPGRLAPGDRYREQWQAIPAVAPADTVSYSVWPGA